MKGLCPFHDEKTPSFHIRPQLGHWHCFGCGEGGDVISFVQKIDHLSFVEAVEMLAGRYGIQLHYEDGGRGGGRPDFGTRRRLLDAHAIAEEYYREQLSSPGAEVGRRFLTERGFDRAAAEHFGVGFAPEGWDAITRVLRGRGFRSEEHTSELQSRGHLVCRLLLEKKKRYMSIWAEKRCQIRMDKDGRSIIEGDVANGESSRRAVKENNSRCG